MPYALTKRIVEESTKRIEPECKHFGQCGGCKIQHIQYKEQLILKQNSVLNALQRIGKIEVEEILPIFPAETPFFYRNKLEFTFSNKRWLTQDEVTSEDQDIQRNALGFHKPGLFDKIIDIEFCHLQAEPSNIIRNKVREYCLSNDYDFYDLRNHGGLMRSMMVKVSSLGEVMVLIQFGRNDEQKILDLLNFMVADLPKINSLYYVVNTKANDYFYDLELTHFYGEPHIMDKLGEVVFKIGPKSFFQTNTKQANNLFDTVVDFAEFQGNEIVYDLYTGLGSIALYIASKVKSVVGIEEIEAAIQDANINAANNNITNAEFYAGDVKNILTPEFALKHGRPDILITDPPRAGMHEQVTQYLLDLAAPKIVYVSCNPATQARDLQLLSPKYRVLKSRAVDMFPHTHHIENVVLLALK
jgi:23S rRNA (uracil1939-C5)-methyltransferase